MDKLQKKVGLTYVIEDVKGRYKSGQKTNDKRIEEYIKTGEHKNLPGLNISDFDDEVDYLNAIKRKMKIN